MTPFHIWGMAALIRIGAVAMAQHGRPDDIITTGITTAVVIVVAAISPDHAWRQPILRVVDTLVGLSTRSESGDRQAPFGDAQNWQDK
jgi:hypothetical protein